MIARRAGLLLALGLLAAPALAQTPPTRLRGAIAGFDGTHLSVATREGPTVTVTLPENFTPSALQRLSFEAITPNSFIATVAAPDAQGVLRAYYVAVFPESMRGTGEGHYDWDLAPGTSMTNATVTAIVQASAGRKLSLVYKGTPIEIVVPPETPIIRTVPASRDDLKPGARVFIVATKTGEGQFSATRVTVGKDGVDPPQ